MAAIDKFKPKVTYSLFQGLRGELVHRLPRLVRQPRTAPAAAAPTASAPERSCERRPLPLRFGMVTASAGGEVVEGVDRLGWGGDWGGLGRGVKSGGEHSQCCRLLLVGWFIKLRVSSFANSSQARMSFRSLA